VLDELGKDHRNPIFAFTLLVLSLAALLVGSKLLVDSGVKLANLLGVSPFLIGIVTVSIGTSLPELAVTVTSLLKKEEKLAVGNILGSNIYNILFGGGILGIFSAKGVNNLTALLFFAVFSLIFCFLIYTYKGRRVPRYFGLILLTLFTLYLSFILFIR
jgi:cation:H+ antiporter